jgi:hypothetical protein
MKVSHAASQKLMSILQNVAKQCILNDYRSAVGFIHRKAVGPYLGIEAGRGGLT